MSDRRKTLAAALAMTLATGTATADAPERWRWVCSPSGHYEMTVQPDGSYQPRADAKDTEPFELSISEWGDREYAACLREKIAVPEYVATVKGNAFVGRLFPTQSDSGNIGLCQQTTIMQSWEPGHLDRPNSFIITNHGSGGFLPAPSVMRLNRVNVEMFGKPPAIDDGWRFTVGSVDLMTMQDSAVKQNTSMWMLTGKCRLVVGH